MLPMGIDIVRCNVTPSTEPLAMYVKRLSCTRNFSIVRICIRFCFKKSDFSNFSINELIGVRSDPELTSAIKAKVREIEGANGVCDVENKKRDC